MSARSSLRDCLKIVNRYVRDPECAKVLRSNFLSQALSRQWTVDQWSRTPVFLRQCFGVQEDISSLNLQIMETYKQVELSKAFERQSPPYKELADPFDSEWEEHIRYFTKEKQIVLASLQSNTAVQKSKSVNGGSND